MKQDATRVYDEVRSRMAAYAQDSDTMRIFMRLHDSASRAGALDTKTKEVIALGIGIAARCAGCIAVHVHDALEAGATYEELVEVVDVAVLMGGGPSVVYGTEALVAAKQFIASR